MRLNLSPKTLDLRPRGSITSFHTYSHLHSYHQNDGVYRYQSYLYLNESKIRLPWIGLRLRPVTLSMLRSNPLILVLVRGNWIESNSVVALLHVPLGMDTSNPTLRPALEYPKLRYLFSTCPITGKSGTTEQPQYLSALISGPYHMVLGSFPLDPEAYPSRSVLSNSFLH